MPKSTVRVVSQHWRSTLSKLFCQQLSAAVVFGVRDSACMYFVRSLYSEHSSTTESFVVCKVVHIYYFVSMIYAYMYVLMSYLHVQMRLCGIRSSSYLRKNSTHLTLKSWINLLLFDLWIVTSTNSRQTACPSCTRT